MRAIILLLICIIFPLLYSFGQVTDDFTDGNFNANPQWFGDTTGFEVIAPVYSGNGSLNASAGDDGALLRSKSTVGDQVLVLPSTQAYGEWIFSVADAQGWAASGANDYKIILMADDSTRANWVDGAVTFNGYYLQFDGDYSDQFIIYKQTGTIATGLLVSGYPATVDGTTAIGRTVRISRSPAGLWTLYVDDGFEVFPTTQRGTSVTDNTHTTSLYFGIATNVANPSDTRILYFDNLYIGPEITDTIPPSLLTVNVIDDSHLQLVFNELLDSASASDVANFSVDNSIGNPATALIDVADNKRVNLSFGSTFTPGLLYNISVTIVSDTAMNPISSALGTFSYIVYPTTLDEHFDDGDFFDNPTWEGDLGIFIVNPESQLQLYSALAGSSYLSTGVDPTGDSLEWQVYIDLNFDPSTSNYLKFFLAGSDSDFGQAGTSGYYLMIGETGTIDAISLYYTNGTTPVQIARGPNGSVALSPEIRVRVKCNKLTNQWLLEADTLGGTNFSFQGSGTHTPVLTQPLFVGPKCTYTSTNITNFIFDDIYCGPVIIDTVAPEILSVAVTSSTTLDVSFSEKLDSTTSTVEGNYSADVLGNPVSAIPDANDLSLVHLEFSSAFPEGELLTLTVTQVTDQSGNPIGSDQGTFFLYEPKAFDVLINEVFTDQTPAPVGIPAKDYIELRNRTGLPLNLSGWTIQPRSTSAWLPFSNAVIQANGYLIVCVSADVSAFSSYGAVIGVSSFSLNNEGTIVLRNDQGVVIHSVDYIDDWYHDDIKKDGGWAMEQVDAANPCGGIDNWKASTDVSGGTPGRVNSVDAQNPDQTAPSARLAIAEDSITVLVYFNETLDSAKAADISGYSISNGIGAPALAQPIGPAYSKVRLVLAQPLQRFTTYILSVGSVVNDCAGNAIGGQTTIRFAISEVCEAKDLLINEILYNPKDNGSDYIELYNNSQKVLDLKYLRMCLYDTLSLQLQNQEEITTEGYLVFPGEYVLLSEDTATVRLQYFTSDPTVFCQPAGLPAMGNSGGVIAVATDNDVMTDMLKFDTGMQFRLLDSDDGIALERINFTRETNEWSNWHSAAESVGYGTPGLPNSQYFEEISADGEISIEPEIFSPDNDGYQDVLNIYYKFGSPGCVANVSVYSPSGRRVRQLVVNELLGAEGVITWDGVNDDNEKSRIGIYVIYFEVFGVSGSVQHYKRACTIGAKF